jgi:RNA polymerase sigma factor (sigma-70 family)
VANCERLVRDIQRALAAGADARDLKEQLWGQCAELVEAIAGRYARGDGQRRADFVGEGYLKFEQVVQAFDAGRGVPFRGYLAGCVEHHLHDKVRKKHDRPVESPGDFAAGGADALVRLRNQEMARRVEEVLDALLPRDKQRERKIMAFKLRHLEGWAVDKIRDWLKVSNSNTVSQWIHRVRTAFEREFPRRYPEYFADVPGGATLQLDE